MGIFKFLIQESVRSSLYGGQARKAIRELKGLDKTTPISKVLSKHAILKVKPDEINEIYDYLKNLLISDRTQVLGTKKPDYLKIKEKGIKHEMTLKKVKNGILFTFKARTPWLRAWTEFDKYHFDKDIDEMVENVHKAFSKIGTSKKSLDTKFCSDCGKGIKKEVKFCEHCGVKQ